MFFANIFIFWNILCSFRISLMFLMHFAFNLCKRYMFYNKKLLCKTLWRYISTLEPLVSVPLHTTKQANNTIMNNNMVAQLAKWFEVELAKWLVASRMKHEHELEYEGREWIRMFISIFSSFLHGFILHMCSLLLKIVCFSLMYSGTIH